jgi:hypothetical protein
MKFWESEELLSCGIKDLTILIKTLSPCYSPSIGQKEKQGEKGIPRQHDQTK